MPVTVGHYCDSRFDIRTAEFDHRMHTMAIFDARVIVLLDLPKEDRRRFGRGIKHAREAHVNSIGGAAVYPQRRLEELGGLVHQRELVRCLDFWLFGQLDPSGFLGYLAVAELSALRYVGDDPVLNRQLRAP